MRILKAPMPYFGGKSRVASQVWERFGDVPNYVEPFAGSLAVLLGRPTEPRVETVNDVDAFISNMWRALRSAPDEVAYWADYPVNEIDLHSRHRWLVEHLPTLKVKLLSDPDYYDAKVAGWDIWGRCLWIGSGWGQEPGIPGGRRQNEQANKRPNLVHEHGKGLMRAEHQFNRNANGTAHQARRPHLTGEQGAMSSLRRWQGGGRGGGSGVHARRLSQQKPMLSGDSGSVGRGIDSAYVLSVGLYEYLGELSTRLRRVRVCCGDWTRVLTTAVTTYMGVTGVFLDPPYDHDLRTRCYAEDHDVSADVRKWAIDNGDNPDFRIALCGYVDEHTEMPETWSCVAWKAHGGYSRTERGVANRSKERIWFSPHCLKPEGRLPFEDVAVDARDQLQCMDGLR